MFVSDSAIFSPSIMKVRITSMEGVNLIDDLRPETTVDQVKIRSLSHFLNPAMSMKTSLYHKVLHVRTGRVLNEDSTLLLEGVRDNDELLLLKRRLPPSPFEGTADKKENRRGPVSDVINKITAKLPKLDIEGVSDETSKSGDFQSELRKILISLIEASQKILCLNPEAAKIFKHAEEISNQHALDLSKVDEKALKQLTDMGFPENRSRKALALNKMSFFLAMEWLLHHEADPDADKPLPGGEDSESLTEDLLDGAMGGVSSEQPKKISNILESFRKFKKREFRPNFRALQNLLEMGFDETEAIDALRIAGNNQDAACEWLLGDRKMRPDDLDKGLDTTGPVYKAIMLNPIVQLGLNNPRCLLAFLQMLENPLTANQWLNDPETGPVLLQVSRIYNAEKNTHKAQSSSHSSFLAGSR